MTQKTTGVLLYVRRTILTKSTPETSPSFTDVDVLGASAAGLQGGTHESFRRVGEMIAGGEGAFRASYLCERIDELAGSTPRAWTCK